MPFLVKQCAQNTLEKHWTQRIPLLQARAPAELAAEVIDQVFAAIERSGNSSGRSKGKDNDKGKTKPVIRSSSSSSAKEGKSSNANANWKVIDFCSGSGGPTPSIEQHLQRRRRRAKLSPIDFYLSDLHPNLDAWVEHSSRSDHLSFLPGPVDATNPPFAAISPSTHGTIHPS